MIACSVLLVTMVVLLMIFVMPTISLEHGVLGMF